MVGAWCFGCCQADRGLPVGFLLLRYSVLFTVESLSLLYLFFISWFICSRRWCVDKLGVFHANIYVSWFTSELRVRLVHLKTRLSPPLKYLYWQFQGGSFMFFYLFFYVFMHVCLFMPCGHLLGKDLPLGSRLWRLIVTLSPSHWCHGSGVVLGCIDSWSLPSFLLQLVEANYHGTKSATTTPSPHE